MSVLSNYRNYLCHVGWWRKKNKVCKNQPLSVLVNMVGCARDTSVAGRTTTKKFFP
jgi:hypothetical protein